MHLGREEMEKLHVLTILASIFSNAFAASIKMSKDKEKINLYQNGNRIKMSTLSHQSTVVAGRKKCSREMVLTLTITYV